MKITTFNPLIASPKAEDLIKLFEELGFEKRHVKTGLNGEGATDVRMRDANGFHVDVAQLDRLPQDMTSIRINVDDFDEAYEFLTARGFVNVQGDKIAQSPTSKGTAMRAPSGFVISLSQHFKKD